MRPTYRVVCIAAVLCASILSAEAQLGCQDLTGTISGLFREANSSQFYNTTLDLVAEAYQPTGAWELVADEEYDFEVTLDDNEGDHVGEVTIRDPEGEIIDRATADPPVSTLTASGTFTAGQVHPLAWKWKFQVVYDTAGKPVVTIGGDWEPAPPPDPRPSWRSAFST